MSQWTNFQNRTVVSFPTVWAPMSARVVINPVCSSSVSNYTSQMVVTVWQSRGYLEIDLTFPPMVESDALQFVDFFAACEGQQACFQLPSPISNIIPSGYGTTGYYQLAANTNKYSVNVGIIYGLSFKIREVLATS